MRRLLAHAGRSWAVVLLAIGMMAAVAPPARAHLVQLPFRVDPACHNPDCRSPDAPPADKGRWTWFHVDPVGIANVPAGWSLVIDNTRFAVIEVRVTHRGGLAVLRRGQFELANNWTLGNNLRFTVPVPGRDVTHIDIGYRNLDSPGLMRTVKAMDDDGHDSYVLRWSVQVTLVTGVLFSAFVYNVFLLTWLRTAFQRWYVVWLAGCMLYMLVWTGALLSFFPFMAGPASVRTAFLLLGLMVVSGAAFFFSLIERDHLPRRLVAFGQASAMLVAFTAVFAAFDTLFPAELGDRLFNLAIVTVTATLFIGCGYAGMRGSRAVWYYIAGWLPALAVLILRIMRNFGLLPQADLLDLAGFAAMGWESLLLSLAIADRFRQLRRDADAADAERETLFRVATTDPLTGLGNRALFQNMMEKALPAAEGIDVIAIDIDFLKQTNDMAGHDAGDALIIAVAERLAAAAGPEATIARVGGDEFVILLTGAARGQLAAVRQMIALSAGVPLRHAGHSLTISMCAGHSSCDDGSTTLSRIYKQADMALYRAKAAGRGCWRSYDASMADAADARARLIAEARFGLAHDQFVPHYLAIVRSDGRLIGHEALLRWQHPRLGLLAPDDILDVVRDPALQPALQAFMLQSALAQAALLRAGGEDLVMAVNFVGSQLQGADAAVAILEELARHDLPPHALVVEITESVAMGGLGDALVEGLECLRDAGVSVALDHFGTGHASLIQMRDVPANIVKIDASFVARLIDSAGNQQVVHAAIDLAHSMGKQVVAEGVEAEAQRQQLVRMGCDLLQGALFGPPQPQPAAQRAAA